MAPFAVGTKGVAEAVAASPGFARGRIRGRRERSGRHRIVASGQVDARLVNIAGHNGRNDVAQPPCHHALVVADIERVAGPSGQRIEDQPVVVDVCRGTARPRSQLSVLTEAWPRAARGCVVGELTLDLCGRNEAVSPTMSTASWPAGPARCSAGPARVVGELFGVGLSGRGGRRRRRWRGRRGWRAPASRRCG